MAFLQKKDPKNFCINNNEKVRGINSKENNTLNNTYNLSQKSDRTLNDYNNYNNLKCLSEENQNAHDSNEFFIVNQKEALHQTYNKDRKIINNAFNLKQKSYNNNFYNKLQNNSNYQNMNKNLNSKRSLKNNIEYKISQIKSELASINSDNLMMKEDIYKYTDMNKYIENEIIIQKEHNETLLNKNQNLIQENEALSLQLEQDEQELNTLIQENEEKLSVRDFRKGQIL